MSPRRPAPPPTPARRSSDPLARRLGEFLSALLGPAPAGARWGGAARALAGVPGLSALFRCTAPGADPDLHPVGGGPVAPSRIRALGAALAPLAEDPHGPGAPRQVPVPAGRGRPAEVAVLLRDEAAEGGILGGMLLAHGADLLASEELFRWIRLIEVALGRELVSARMAEYRQALELLNALELPVRSPERPLLARALAGLRTLSGADLVGVVRVGGGGGDRLDWLAARGLDPEVLATAKVRLAARAGLPFDSEEGRIDRSGPPARPGARADSELVLPLLGPGGEDRGRVGFFAAARGVFDSHALGLLGLLAPPLSAALGRLEAGQELRDHTARLESAQAKVESQLELARRVQTQLASPCPPPPAGLAVAERCQPCAQVGGDFFAARAFGRNRYGIAIADVSGKGLPAGLLMAHTRGALLAAWEGTSDPAAVLDRLNRVVYDSTDDYLFVTMLVLLVDLRREKASFACAGHEPLRRLARAGGLEEFTSGDPPLGILEGLRFGLHDVPFAPGDALVLMTDGCHDQLGPAGERYGRARLDDLLAGVGPRPTDLVGKVMGALAAWRAGLAPADDATCLALGRKAR